MCGAGLIPPQFRQFVYADLTPEEIEATRLCCRVIEEDGTERFYNDEEMAEIKRIRGVIDTRDGSYHPNRYFKD